MSPRSMPTALLRVLWLCCLASLAALLWLGGHASSRARRQFEQARALGRSEADVAARAIDERMKPLQGLAEGLSSELSSGALSPADVDARVDRASEGHQDLFGLAVAFAPYAVDPETRLRSAYVVMRDDRREHVAIESLYDYTKPEHRWFADTMAQGSGWTEPFFGQASNATIVAYCSRFSLPRPGGARLERAGVVCATVSLEGVRQILNGLDLGKTGYAFLVSAKGALLVHPRRDMVERGETLSDIATAGGDLGVAGAGALSKGESGEVEARSRSTGLRHWVFYRALPTTRWTVALVVFQSELTLGARGQSRELMGATASAVSLALFAALVVAGRNLGSQRALWRASASVSAAFLVGTGYLWLLILGQPAGEDRMLLVDRAGVARLVETHLSPGAGGGALVRVPTGVVVQSLAFVDARTVVAAGWVWQRYPAESPVTRGFVFPDWAPEQDSITEAYRRREGPDEVVGWFFKVTLREPFSARKFPLDSREVRLRIWPADIDGKVVLVPDLDAYRQTNPTSLPGLAPGLSVPGWGVERSYFTFAERDVGADFGLRARGTGGAPELWFDVVLRRTLIDPLVTHVAPLLVAAIMLFALLMIGTRDPLRAPAFGFSTSTVVGTAAALFFVVLLSHVQMRSQLAETQIVYMEWAYLVTYLLVLAVSIDAYVLASRAGKPLRPRENAAAALLYWPLSFGVLFAVTLVVFY